MSFALDGMDRALLPHISGHPGIFIEAGAYDGLTQSNTALLEFSFGWSGLLVEPIPELAARCRANRPASRVEQAALVAPDHHGDAITMTYCNRQEDIHPYRVTVPARTLSSMIEAAGLPRIDFMSLDLEGHEAAALRGVDFERHRPELLLVEISNDRDAVESVLAPWYDAVAELSDHRHEQPAWYDVLYRAR